MAETNSFPEATQQDAKAFCDNCEWVYQCWSMHLALGERLDQCEALFPVNSSLDSPVAWFVDHHMELSSEYTIMQLAKLHDRPNMGREGTLSIGFFLDQEGIWSSDEKENLARIRSKLDDFYKKHIKQVRNKILAHIDRKTVRNNTRLGNFTESEGESYLSGLSKVAAAVWEKWDCRMEKPYQGSQRAFDYSPNSPIRDHYRNDAKLVVDTLLQVPYED